MEGILEVDEACKYLKMSKVTLYRHARNGVIPAFKVGGSWKFNKNSLDDWIQQRVKEDTAARSLKSTAQSKEVAPKRKQSTATNRRKK
jgi:excisionase family DNA binding protein